MSKTYLDSTSEKYYTLSQLWRDRRLLFWELLTKAVFEKELIFWFHSFMKMHIRYIYIMYWVLPMKLCYSIPWVSLSQRGRFNIKMISITYTHSLCPCLSPCFSNGTLKLPLSFRLLHCHCSLGWWSPSASVSLMPPVGKGGAWPPCLLPLALQGETEERDMHLLSNPQYTGRNTQTHTHTPTWKPSG